MGPTDPLIIHMVHTDPACASTWVPLFLPIGISRLRTNPILVEPDSVVLDSKSVRFGAISIGPASDMVGSNRACTDLGCNLGCARQNQSVAPDARTCPCRFGLIDRLT